MPSCPMDGPQPGVRLLVVKQHLLRNYAEVKLNPSATT